MIVLFPPSLLVLHHYSLVPTLLAFQAKASTDTESAFKLQQAWTFVACNFCDIFSEQQLLSYVFHTICMPWRHMQTNRIRCLSVQMIYYLIKYSGIKIFLIIMSCSLTHVCFPEWDRADITTRSDHWVLNMYISLKSINIWPFTVWWIEIWELLSWVSCLLSLMTMQTHILKWILQIASLYFL